MNHYRNKPPREKQIHNYGKKEATFWNSAPESGKVLLNPGDVLKANKPTMIEWLEVQPSTDLPTTRYGRGTSR